MYVKIHTHTYKPSRLVLNTQYISTSFSRDLGEALQPQEVFRCNVLSFPTLSKQARTSTSDVGADLDPLPMSTYRPTFYLKKYAASLSTAVKGTLQLAFYRLKAYVQHWQLAVQPVTSEVYAPASIPCAVYLPKGQSQTTGRS